MCESREGKGGVDRERREWGGKGREGEKKMREKTKGKNRQTHTHLVEKANGTLQFEVRGEREIVIVRKNETKRIEQIVHYILIVLSQFCLLCGCSCCCLKVIAKRSEA